MFCWKKTQIKSKINEKSKQWSQKKWRYLCFFFSWFQHHNWSDRILWILCFFRVLYLSELFISAPGSADLSIQFHSLTTDTSDLDLLHGLVDHRFTALTGSSVWLMTSLQLENVSHLIRNVYGFQKMHKVSSNFNTEDSFRTGRWFPFLCAAAALR